MRGGGFDFQEPGFDELATLANDLHLGDLPLDHERHKDRTPVLEPAHAAPAEGNVMNLNPAGGGSLPSGRNDSGFRNLAQAETPSSPR